MSHNYCIRNLLNIKDKNIFFEENFCSKETVKGITSKVFYGTLTYQPRACYVCGHVFDHQIIKHGFKTSIIKMPSVSGFNAYLKLKKQRYYCKHCESTFTLTTKNCCISNNTKAAMALHAKEKISEEDIARHLMYPTPRSIESLIAFITTLSPILTISQNTCVLTILNR